VGLANRLLSVEVLRNKEDLILTGKHHLDEVFGLQDQRISRLCSDDDV